MYKLVRASRAFDVWSFGVLLYALCSRESLFKVNSDDDITQMLTRCGSYTIICPISLQPVLDLSGEAMTCHIALPKGWVVRYGLAILIGLMIVQAGLAVGHGCGLSVTGADEDVLNTFNFFSDTQGLIIEGMRGDQVESGPTEMLLEYFNYRLDSTVSTTSGIDDRQKFSTSRMNSKRHTRVYHCKLRRKMVSSRNVAHGTSF
ncbi:unnamed protein product [Cylindrotheca closterium]|uniref:Protein kinase domain-containing protein n=1 Tax=Cylindrotheca closterium TaxID=2856 RepID=A0AAD2G0Y8_9STRA|nr:unnamed protein product [Cylindrotheca closterium]